MNPLLQWIQLNPKAFTSLLVSLAGIIIPLILRLSGHPDDPIGNQILNYIQSLADWGGGAIALIFGTSAINHATRGPDLPPQQQAAAIVAAIQGPPSPMAVEQVKVATEEVKEQVKDQK